jgi:high-affinity iron transporter
VLVTLVIGLREGLEAALIVAIIATFLRRANASLRPMWWGVGAALALSLAVGVTLELVAVGLDQAAQEALEAIIGAAAAAMVTAMVLWMSKHSRTMKKDLEHAAGEALSRGSAWALAAMAFLAVLREGFESAVFLLATFQSSSAPLAAGLGAVLGFGLAAAIGVGIYRGAVRIDLGRLFRVSAAFLVVVAAGLVLQTLRKAHEATWLNIGQERVADLSWLAPAGSVRAALVTGVLGIPADPRLVEVVGWACYLVPMLALVLWPARRRPSAATSVRLRWWLAAGAAVGALTLAVAVPAAPRPTTGTAVATAADGSTIGTVGLVVRGTQGAGGDGTAGLTLTTATGEVTTTALGAGETVDVNGVRAAHHTVTSQGVPAGAPAVLSLDDLVALVGRVPVGIDPAQDTGPFDARWAAVSTTEAWTTDGMLLDATSATTTTVTLTGGGLAGSRTVRVDGAKVPATAASWSLPDDYRATALAAVDTAEKAARERLLWTALLPAALAFTALYQALRALAATRRRPSRAASAAPAAAREVATVVTTPG